MQIRALAERNLQIANLDADVEIAAQLARLDMGLLSAYANLSVRGNFQIELRGGGAMRRILFNHVDHARFRQVVFAVLFLSGAVQARAEEKKGADRVTYPFVTGRGLEVEPGERVPVGKVIPVKRELRR